MPSEPDWYDELADALRSRKVDPDEIVAEAKAHCAATGEPPEAAFGNARTYAAHLTTTDDPEEARFQNVAERHSWERQPTIFRLLFWTGTTLAGFAAAGWLMVGARLPLTEVELFVWCVNLAWLVFFYLRMDARKAGRLSTGRRYLFVGLLVLVAGTLVGTFLPVRGLAHVPFPAFVLAGLLLVAAGWWLGDRWNKAHPPVTRLPTDVWLDRLAGLLEGRYRLPAARAREFRAEAESHLHESGGNPEQEFGPVDDYAAELAERSGLYPRPEGWLTLFAMAVIVTFFGVVTVLAASAYGILDVRSAVLAFLTLLFAGRLVWVVRNDRRATPLARRR